MDVNNTGGAFLHELSAVERAQPRAVTTGVTMTDKAAQVQCLAGPSVSIPFTAGRGRIAQLLSQAAGPLVRPDVEDPHTYPDAPNTEQLWAELLDDLGSYLPDLSHADPQLRLVAVHRDRVNAHIEVTNGVRELTYEVPLDTQEMPAAVTVDIARVFPSSPDSTGN